MSPRFDPMSNRHGGPIRWHDPGVPTCFDAVPANRLETRPDLVLPALAAALRRLAAGLHPADSLAFQLDGREFWLGRHEIAGLALLFEEWDLDPATRGVALARAGACLRTGRVLAAGV